MFKIHRLEKNRKFFMKDLILNFLLRVVFGAIAIFAVNSLLSGVLGGSFHLGLNPLNLLTVGTLGISGFGLIFAISMFAILWKMTKEFAKKFCAVFRLVLWKIFMIKSNQDKRLSSVPFGALILTGSVNYPLIGYSEKCTSVFS